MNGTATAVSALSRMVSGVHQSDSRYLVCPICSEGIRHNALCVRKHVAKHYRRDEAPDQAAYYSLIMWGNRRGCNKLLEGATEEVQTWVRDYIGKLKSEHQAREYEDGRGVRIHHTSIRAK